MIAGRGIYNCRSLQLTTPAPQAAVLAAGHAPEATTETAVVSLKTISKNFWRHL
ncbi:hypothetical protein [Nostoc sp. CCY 9925]|uniref:hypothetical protein n=1 Tax=Nostoc sp. CCY 9925 TaxID=3103865 RepID=UPI0039C6B85E